MAKDWENRKESFTVVDVRTLSGNFLPSLLSKAGKVEVDGGMCVVQSFELDELFSLFVWNGGVGTFASEIGPSSLFGAYQLIKTSENKGKSREEVMNALLEKFGEKNPEVNVMPQDPKNK